MPTKNNVPKKHYPLIRTIYLYLFALVGLTLLIIGAVRFINMGLKVFVFTKAEDEQRLYSKQPPMPVSLDRLEKINQSQECVVLSQDEKNLIGQWVNDYRNWQEGAAKIDVVASRRQSDASINLSLIIVGLPLFWYHWRIIRRETKNKKQD